jgi:hypothetical protein
MGLLPKLRVPAGVVNMTLPRLVGSQGNEMLDTYGIQLFHAPRMKSYL